MRKLACLLAAAGVTSLWSAGAAAQTKIEWSDSCAKPDPDYTVQVGDRTGHSFGLSQIKCQPSKPVEIGGDKGKEAMATISADSSGERSHEHGVYLLTLESGDKAALQFQGIVTVKDGKPSGSRGTWSFASGTGKLNGIKGKGTFHCSPSGEGWNCGAEGEYELAK